ncbi:5350_t:CDS:2, partial [Ambispora leptoticha]
CPNSVGDNDFGFDTTGEVSTAINLYVVLGLSQVWGGQIDETLRAFFGLIYCIVAVACLFGLIGSVVSSRRSVRFFSTILWFLFIAHITIDIVQVIEMYKHKDDRIADCIGNVTQAVNDASGKINNSTANITLANNATNAATDSVKSKVEKHSPADCQKWVDIAMWAIAIWYGIINLLLLYFCNVAARFARQLESEYRHHKLRDHTRSAVNRSGSRTSLNSSLNYQPHKGIRGGSD